MKAFAAAVLGATVMLAAAWGGDDHVRTVELTIRHSRFAPAQLQVRAGTTVRFVVHNTDFIDHELLIGDQAFQDRHESGTEAHHGARPGEVSVARGETATTTYEFDRPGVVLLGCHLPGHWDHGMRGEVTVTP